MSKELEYIQRNINIVKQQIKGSNMKIIVTDAVTKYQYDYYENELQTLESIEQALQRLESIDNANPSEALECLEYIGKTCYVEAGDVEEDCLLYAKDYVGYNTIKQALLKTEKEQEKEVKALEIIKKKTVDIWLIQNKKTLKQYNSMVDESRQLTEEEFSLLKEVLE